MTIQEIKNSISELAKKHAAINEENIGDINNAELLESQAQDLIISFCEAKGYLVNGFPTEKRKLDEEELDDDDFSQEHFQLYLDILTYQKKDIADLTWHYTESFWPEYFESKEDFIAQAKERAESDSFYDVTL
jgi:hypothetical protein